MRERDDEQLEALLKDFFSEALDGQRGRAELHFRRYLDQAMRTAWRQRTWLIGAFATGLAASVAALWASPLFHVTTQSPHAAPGGAFAQQTALVPAMEQVVHSRMIDEGVVMLDDNTPVRVLRRHSLEQTRWFDEHAAVKAQKVIPRDDLTLIRLTTY